MSVLDSDVSEVSPGVKICLLPTLLSGFFFRYVIVNKAS